MQIFLPPYKGIIAQIIFESVHTHIQAVIMGCLVVKKIMNSLLGWILLCLRKNLKMYELCVVLEQVFGCYIRTHRLSGIFCCFGLCGF